MYYDVDGITHTELWPGAFDMENRRVVLTRVGSMVVSTVLLVLDHNWDPYGPPLIFESMVFGDGDGDQWTSRYSTKEQAIVGHEQIVSALAVIEAAEPVALEKW